MKSSMPLRAVVYQRVSTQAQATQGDSLASQEAMAIERCQREGWELVGTYQDVMSGRKDARPELARMMADAAAGAFDVVIVYRTDRLARSMLKTLHLAGEFTDLGIRLVSLTQPIELTGTLGRMLLATVSGLAEMEVEGIGIRTRDAHRHRIITKRRMMGNVPFGYTRNKDGSISIDEEAAAWVPWIYQQIIDRVSMRGIAIKLNSEGIRRPRGGPWSSTLIRQLVTSPSYMGMVTHGRIKVTRDSKGRSHKKLTTDYLSVKGDHEAIVSEEVWRQANDALLENKRYASKTIGAFDRHPWLGLVVCGACGKSFGVAHPRGKAFLYCNTRRNGGAAACSARGISPNVLARHIVPTMSEALSAWNQQVKKSRGRPIKPKVSIEKQIQKLEADIDAEADLYRARAQTAEKMEKRVAELHRRIEELKRSGANASQVIPVPVFEGDLKEAWSEATDEKRSGLIRKLAERIIVGEQEITFFWRPGLQARLGESFTVPRIAMVGRNAAKLV